MAFNLSGIMNLNTSGFTSGLSKASSEMGKFNSKVSQSKGGLGKVSSGIKGMGSSAGGAIGSIKGMVGAFAGLKVVQKVVEGVSTAFKVGFKEATDMEGYRTQLETATKDTQKAGKLMSGAIKYANKTPFETGEVVQATATMEAYGLSSEKYLSDIGDMAGATNKGIMQSTEAMADAATGEFERLKEFGITKDMIMAKAADKYGEKQVFDAKGHMMDQAKAMDSIQSLMQEKFKGGAEKQSKTIKGMMSTVTGVFKGGLASIMGIATEGEKAGTIIEGSMLDKIGKGISFLADNLQKMQDSGAFSAIGKVFSDGLSGMGTAIETLTPYFNKFKNTFMPIIQSVVGYFQNNLIPAFTNLYSEILPRLGNFFMSACTFIQTAWNEVLKPVFDAFAPVVQQSIEAIGPIISGLLDVLSGVLDFISGVFSGDWSLAWEGIQEIAGGAIDAIIGFFDGLITKAKETAGAIKEAVSNSFVGKAYGAIKGVFTKDEVPADANGTSYSMGGLTQINERGGELRQLSSGETIIPADRSKELVQNSSTDNSKKDVKIYIDAKGMSVDEMVTTLQMRLANI